MTDVRSILERGVGGTTPPPDGYERMLRRRDRRRRTQRLTAAAVGLAVATVAILVAAKVSGLAPEPSPAEPPPVQIVAPLGADLFEVDPGTGVITPVLTAEGDQWGPERAPDGVHITYTSVVKGDVPQVYVLNPDGTQRRMTDLPRGAQDPTWSPDGTQIAFASRGHDGDIYVVDAEGGRPRRIGGTTRADYGPDWSPDGRTIVFDTTYPNQIYSIPALGGELTRLTNGRGDLAPAWSPDGSWIAYTHFHAVPGEDLMNDDDDLWLMRPDGSDAHRLADAGQYEAESPSWSPDGRSIVILGKDHGAPHIVIDVPTGAARTLSSTRGWEWNDFLLGDESWRWIGDTGAMSWDRQGILAAYAETGST